MHCGSDCGILMAARREALKASPKFGRPHAKVVRRLPWTRRGANAYKPAIRCVSTAPAAQVAQLVEHATENRSVGGSIPPLGTIPPFNILIFLSILAAGHSPPFRRDNFAPSQFLHRALRHQLLIRRFRVAAYSREV
jgi:hypothetical protein